MDKVDKNWDPTLFEHDEVLGTTKQDRDRIKAEIGTGSTFAYRQRQWLLRGKRKTNWRPRPLHRVGAKKVAMVTGNHIRCSSVLKGLVHFKQKPDCKTWSQPSRWPGIGMALDQDGKNVSCMNGLMYGYGLNAWPWWDDQHKIKNDWEGTLQDIGIKDFEYLMLIVINHDFGPNEDDQRFIQRRSVLLTIFEKKRWYEVPSFVELAPKMIEEVESGGIYIFPRLLAVEQELWNFLHDRAKNGSLGRRTSMCRFGGVIAGTRKFKPGWTATGND